MPETAQTLDRGIRILTLAGAAPHGLTVAELAAELAVGRAVVYRLVATLERNGLVRRGADGRIRLWLGLLELAHDVQPHLRDIALPRLRSLAEAVGATAHLTIADGGEALALAVAEPSWTDLHVAYRVGSRHPLGRAPPVARSCWAGTRTRRSPTPRPSASCRTARTASPHPSAAYPGCRPASE